MCSARRTRGAVASRWWVAVPNHNNGRSIYKPVETAYIHIDSSGYGWGAVLNETTEARGFCNDCGREPHITYKELKMAHGVVSTVGATLLHDLIDDLVIKLHISGASATLIVPYWPDRGWHQRLSEMAPVVVVLPPYPDLFAPGRLGVHAGVGPPKWHVVVFRLPLWARCPAPVFVPSLVCPSGRPGPSCVVPQDQASSACPKIKLGA
eukprot:jgi/Tetstr1/429117/TSEL_019079.t1